MIKKTVYIFLLLIIFLNAAEARQWSTGGPLSELQQRFDIHHFDINLEVNADEQFISGYVDVHVYALDDEVNQIELDLINHYEVSEVSGPDGLLDFEHSEDKLRIRTAIALRQGDYSVFRISYSGQPPTARNPPWQGGFNWSKDAEGYHWVGVSCQGEGGKIWLPVKDHPVSRADSTAINITVPEPYYVASNGVLQDITSPRDGYSTYRWITRYPIHNYNISINIARYEVFEKSYLTKYGTVMPVKFYVLPEHRHHAQTILEITIQKLRQLRDYYGEYGFISEKFGLVQTDYLGMEHQTINSYGNNFEYDYAGSKPYDWLLLHEMGHEWWGNLVTVRDWADFWIHEGITTFTDASFLWDFAGEDVYHAKLSDYIENISHRQPIIPGTDITSTEVYNHDVYYKGAYFMHSLTYVLGRGTLLNLLREFVSRNKYGYTSTYEFRRFMERFSGLDLSGLFDLYLYTTEVPEIRIEKTGARAYEISIPNISFYIPMDVQLGDEFHRLNLGPESVTVRSSQMPVVDPKNWFLKSEMN